MAGGEIAGQGWWRPLGVARSCGSRWRSVAVSESGSRRLETVRIGVENGGVIAVELTRDLGERERGEIAREVHGELPCSGRPERFAWARGDPAGRRRARSRRLPGSRRRWGSRRAGGIRGGGPPPGDSIERLASEGRGDRLAEHRGDGGHAGHRSLEAADVSGRLAGDLVQRGGVVEVERPLDGHSPQERGSGAKVGRPELDAEAPAEAVTEALREPRERLGRTVAGEDYLLPGGVKRVERVDELLLRVLLALERLDVVDRAARRACGSAA